MVGVPNYLSYVKTEYRPTFRGHKLIGELHVTVARVKTEKSNFFFFFLVANS